MLKVGLTGGMGSGKTTVARIFEVMGIPVFYADVEAKKLLAEDHELRLKIIHAIGSESYDGSKPNRQYIAQIVFNNPEKLAALNGLIHPATIQQAKAWMNKQTTPFAIKEAAILFESNAHKELDYVIGVQSPEEVRIANIKQRDHLAIEEIKARMAQQMNQEDKMKLCDFVILNDDSHSLIEQVLLVYKLILTKR
ncbi:MAG: dephospho-CoA kinase [Bacteroidetes bacterium]|nr:dephospho-CoA kinase [Bacteroidota bacterium]